MVTDLEYSFLCACQEVILRQQELVPLLAQTLRVSPEKVFYHWAIPPRCKQGGIIEGTDWKYFFHGLECDLKNVRDGRFLRIDFGPKGRFDTFSGWGVLQFVMTAKPPWREFPALRAVLAEESPPYHELSGSHQKMTSITEHLEELCLVEIVDPELCASVERPVEFSDYTQEIFWDRYVCNRWILSELGKRVLAEGRI